MGISIFFRKCVSSAITKRKNQAPLKGHGLKKVWYLSVDIMVLFHLGVLLHLQLEEREHD